MPDGRGQRVPGAHATSESAGADLPALAPLTPLIGRESELEEIAGVLETQRLLTLTGVGGVGKTRLAIETARHLSASEREGEVFVIELAPLDSPARLAPAVQRSVRSVRPDIARPAAGSSAFEVTVQLLSDRDALLVLDNCEHLLDAAAAMIASLLVRCPRLRVLATSRQPLGVDGETVWPVPPLSLPAEHADDELAAVAESDAGRLFIDRAARSRPGFGLTAETAGDVALICGELEGLPLAIELAAGRARVLSPAQIAAGLADRMRLLGGGPRRNSERLRTMRGSMDWSHALLEEPERALLRRLAISPVWTLDAVQAACPDNAEDRAALLDTLGALVEQGLVIVVDGDSELRYRMLETVRDYALEHLQNAGEEQDVRRRHMRHFRKLAAHADRLLEGPAGRRRMERDTQQLFTALEFAMRDDPQNALAMAADLGPWWLIHQSYEEARNACARVLAAAPDDDARARAQVLWAAALLAVLDEDYEQARTYAQEAFPLADASGDQRTIGRWMIMAGNAQRSIDANAAATIGAQAVTILRAEQDTHGLAFALANLALSEGMRDRFDAVRDTCGEFDALAGEKPPWLSPWVENALAWADISQGAPRAACKHCARALQIEAGRPTLTHYIATAHRLQALALAGRAHQARAQGLAELDRSQRAGLAIASAAIERSVTIAELALGDLDGAEARAERGLSGPHRYVTAEWRETLMRIALARDDAQTAREHAQELRAFAESTGSARKLAQANWGQGIAGLLSDELDGTHEALHAALRTQAEQGLAPEAIDTLEALGELALACKHATRASRLIGAARSARQAFGVVPIPGRADGSPALSRRDHQELLDSERCVAALADGEAMTLTRAIEFARRGRGRRERPTRGWASLSPVESEVATLAAEGLTNPQIARHMYISRGTVKNHLSHIYKKLDVSNRVALTAATATRTPDQPAA